MSFPIGIQLYNLRKEIEADFEGTLKTVKELGYEGVEFAGLFGHSPKEVRDMCDSIGLVPISAHVPYVDMIKDPYGVLSQYAEIGCKYVAVPYLSAEHRPGTPNFEYVVHFIEILGKVAKKLGMQLLYHNHDFEFMKIGGKYALDILYETVPAELLCTELDTCWVKVGGADPCEYIRKYAGRAPIVHLKDFFGEKSENMYELIGIENKAPRRPSGFEFRPLGAGLQNFPAILDAAKESDVEWVIFEQDNPSMGLTPVECAKKSIEYLKEINK